MHVVECHTHTSPTYRKWCHLMSRSVSITSGHAHINGIITLAHVWHALAKPVRDHVVRCEEQSRRRSQIYHTVYSTLRRQLEGATLICINLAGLSVDAYEMKP